MVGASIAIQDLRRIAQIVAEKVGRTVRQQPLAESRLCAKTAEREELRRYSRSPETWVASVVQALGDPGKRGAGLRALRFVVNSYVQLPHIDHRVENALRKAHQAAERGDLERLQREAQRLEELASELDLPELKDPIPALYMWAGSEVARERIAGVQTEGDTGGDTGSSVETPLTNLVEEPATSTELSLKAGDGVTEATLGLRASLVEELSALASPRRGSPVDWRLEQILDGEARPPADIAWPSTAGLTARLGELVGAAADAAKMRIEQGSLPIERCRGVQTVLADSADILARAGEVSKDVEEVIERARAIAHHHASALQ